ncbi:uncharacterized protein LOC114724944 [Neltuma alba]|uniref:uncharacterized protein LOC114724944 n=1 Tax=Neltuma alba TaxID=207710 RepID=UPI0010A49534|nr:uncharacterized protein LOC114724944 [Prosopis alba]
MRETKSWSSEKRANRALPSYDNGPLSSLCGLGQDSPIIEEMVYLFIYFIGSFVGHVLNIITHDLFSDKYYRFFPSASQLCTKTKQFPPTAAEKGSTEASIFGEDELLQPAAAAGGSSAATRLSSRGICEGRLSATGISATGISSAVLSSARISASVCTSVSAASASAAKFNGTWLFGRMFGCSLLLLPFGCVLLRRH